jgi:hypothetical protein
MNQCIVCESKLIESFQTSDKKKHWKCLCCFAKFLDKKHYINSDIEKERYLEHENIIEDEGYRNFLSRLSIPLKKNYYLAPRVLILDVGMDQLWLIF